MLKRWLPVKFYDTDSAGSGTGAENEAGAKNESTEAKTFTQEEITAMLAKEKQQGKNSVLRALGLKNIDEGKTAIEAGRTAANANKTAEEQATETLNAERTARTKAENDLTVANRKIAVMQAGFSPDYVDDVVAVASLKVDDDHDFESVIEGMKKSHQFYLVGAETKEEKKGTGSAAAGYKKDQGKTVESYGAQLAKKKIDAQKSVNAVKFFS